MYAFFVCLFICLFVLIDQSGYCYFCSVMRSFCVLRDGQGIFFNIHIYIYTYIYSGVGGRIFNPLQCSCEAVLPEMGLAAKRLFCLLWQTSAYTGPPPHPLLPHLGRKLNSFLVFRLRKQGGKGSTAKPPRGRLGRTALSSFSCCWWFFLKVLNPQWKGSLSHIWQRHFLKCPHSRCWLFHTFEFNTGISFLLTNTFTRLEGGFPVPPRPHFVLLMTGYDVPVTYYFKWMAVHLGFCFSTSRKLTRERVTLIECIWTDRLKSKFIFLKNKISKSFYFTCPCKLKTGAERNIDF